MNSKAPLASYLFFVVVFVLSLDRACEKSLQCFTLHQVHPGPFELAAQMNGSLVHSGPRHPNSHPILHRNSLDHFFWIVPHNFNNHPSAIECSWFFRFVSQATGHGGRAMKILLDRARRCYPCAGEETAPWESEIDLDWEWFTLGM